MHGSTSFYICRVDYIQVKRLMYMCNKFIVYYRVILINLLEICG